MRSRNPGLRTIDVARRAGCSVQQVRNLEQAGVLPPTTRTPAGYRTYTETHAAAAETYTVLAVGVGPTEAKTILRAAHRSPASELLDLLDAAHARLHTERRDVALAQDAVAAISTEPIHEPRAADSMTISELAGALGVRTSALRHWEAEGLLTPARSFRRFRAQLHPRRRPGRPNRPPAPPRRSPHPGATQAHARPAPSAATRRHHRCAPRPTQQHHYPLPRAAPRGSNARRPPRIPTRLRVCPSSNPSR